MRTLADLFGKSPFGPLVEHGAKVRETVRLVPPLFTALAAGDQEQVQALAEKISTAEHEADLIKERLRNHLPRSLFLPVNRGDMLAFLKEQDGIADEAEDISVLLTMRTMEVPPGMAEELQKLVEQVVGSCELCLDCTEAFRTLMESSFSGKELDKVLETIGVVGRKEWEADRMQFAMAKMFLAREKEMEPMPLWLWIRIIRELGALADHAQNAADLLRLMISKG